VRHVRVGLQLGVEGRYLGKDFAGQLDSAYLPHDRIADIEAPIRCRLLRLNLFSLIID